jgi:hypothetical protein
VSQLRLLRGKCGWRRVPLCAFEGVPIHWIGSLECSPMFGSDNAVFAGGARGAQRDARYGVKIRAATHPPVYDSIGGL